MHNQQKTICLGTAVAKDIIGDDNPAKVDDWINENSLRVGISQKALSAIVVLAPALIGGPALSLAELVI